MSFREKEKTKPKHTFHKNKFLRSQAIILHIIIFYLVSSHILWNSNLLPAFFFFCSATSYILILSSFVPSADLRLLLIYKHLKLFATSILSQPPHFRFLFIKLVVLLDYVMVPFSFLFSPCDRILLVFFVLFFLFKSLTFLSSNKQQTT